MEGKTNSNIYVRADQSVPHILLNNDQQHIIFSPIGHNTLSLAGMAPPLNMTADPNFLIGREVLSMHVWTSMDHREMHDGLAL